MTTKEYFDKQKSKRSAELEELAKRVEALEKKNTESEDENELNEIGAELEELKNKKAELEAELAEIDAQIAELDKPNEEEGKPTEEEEQPKRNKLNFMTKESRGANTMNIEERNAAAKKFVESGKMTVKNEETRAMLVSSGKIATPTGVNEQINELNKATSIVDLVNVQDCANMGGNTIAYEFTAPEGGITVEGETYAEGETVTDFVKTTPQKVTTISYISEETRKLTPLAYEALVKKNAMFALRKKVAAIIVDKIIGSALSKKITIAKIDEKTLRTLALGYGGEEDVEGNAVLMLNKNTLTALGDVRGTNEKKAVYEITPDASNPNTGIIKDGGLSVQYVLNAKFADNVFAYGQAGKFELDLFGDYDIKVSEDFKFDKGLLAVRGSAMIDGAVAFKDGFTVATVG
jgi:HK97 family phage major capsid protein